MSFKENCMAALDKAGSKIEHHLPDILMVGGLISGGLALYSAIKNTISAEEILDETKAEIDELKNASKEETVIENSDEGVVVSSSKSVDRKKLTGIYLKAGSKLLAHYYPTIIFSLTSATCILYANGMMKKRTAQTIAAYNTLDTIFKKYRNNVIEKYGEEVDHQMRYGIKKENVDVIEYDENGNEVKSKKKVATIPNDFLNTSEYSRFFTKYNEKGILNLHWESFPEGNALFLQNTQRYANDLLNLRGHLFLNEVYDMLGFERTESGQVVGWVKGEGDGTVKFGIDNIYRAISDGSLEYGQGILLEFNVQGIIIDKI